MRKLCILGSIVSRAAINASVVTAIGDRDAQIGDGAAITVAQAALGAGRNRRIDRVEKQRVGGYFQIILDHVLDAAARFAGPDFQGYFDDKLIRGDLSASDQSVTAIVLTQSIRM